VDAQSVKNTDTADEKGYDAGKKVSGIKRHLVVDSNGLPHAIVVTTANITDREGTLQAFSLHSSRLPKFKKLWRTVAIPVNLSLTRPKES
jgi:hypothetical protein